MTDTITTLHAIITTTTGTSTTTTTDGAMAPCAYSPPPLPFYFL